jgi:hypothetical protein
MAPVHDTEVRLGVMGLAAQLIPGVGPQADGVAHRSLCACDPMGQHDAPLVRFAGDRALDRLGLDVPHLRHAPRGAAALAARREADGGGAPPPTLTASGP